MIVCKNIQPFTYPKLQDYNADVYASMVGIGGCLDRKVFLTLGIGDEWDLLIHAL